MNEVSKSPKVDDNSLTPNGHQLSDWPQSCSPRSDLFKNNDKNIKELRRRRSETVVELRKQRKEDNLEKRRHIYEDLRFEDYFPEAEQENKLSAEEIIEVLKSYNSHEIPVNYIREMRRLISIQMNTSLMPTPDISLRNQFLANDVITKLINCLVSEDCSISLLIEVVTLMAQLSSGGKEHTTLLVKLGIVPNLISLLSYDNFTVVEQAVVTVANICSSTPEMRDLIMNTEFLNKLLPLVISETSVSPSKYIEGDHRMHLVRAMSWALSVMCQHKDMNSYKMVETLLDHYFIKLLDYPDCEVKSHALRALSATTERDLVLGVNESAQALRFVQLVTSNISLLATIIEYLWSHNNDVVLYSIRIIGNIVSWGESYAQIVIQAGALNKFNSLVTHQSARIQREVVFTISNITAGNCAQIEAVIDANIVPLIVELLYLGDYKTQLEAIHVLLNISAISSINQIYYLINIDDTIPNMNVFDAMATMLTGCDAKTIETTLQVYNNLFIFAKKVNILEKVVNKCESCAAIYHFDLLQNYSNSQVAALATHIIEQYFSQESSLEEHMEDMILNTNVGSDGDKQMELNFCF